MAEMNGTEDQSGPDSPLIPKVAQLSPMDMLLDRVNGEGRYQWITFMIFNLHWFLVGWFLLGLNFYFEEEPFDCTGVDVTEEMCNKYVCSLPSEEWRHYLNTIPRNIAYEWEPFMVCESYVKSILQSLISIGSFFGFFVFPYYADNYGRKITLSIAWGFFTAGVLILTLANGPIMVGIGEFLIGFGGNPAITLDFSFINEQSLGKSRQYFSIGVQITFAVAESLLGYVLFWIDNWRISLYIILGISVAINFLHLFLIETPKYMISRDIPKTVDIFNRIAKINNRPELTMEQVLETYDKEQIVPNENMNITVLFKYGSLRGKTIASGIMFLGIQIIYYAAVLNIGSIGDTSRFNQLLMGLSQGVGYIAAEFAIPLLPRRPFSLISLALSGALCVAIALVTILSDINALELVLLFAMRFVLCMYWASFYVYLAELYPTRVRSLAFGWASAIGTIGSSACPYLVLATSKLDLNQWILPGALGLIAAVCAIWLPETLNKPMQEEIYEKKKSTIVKMTLRSQALEAQPPDNP